MAGGVISRSGLKLLVNSSSRLEIKIAHQSSAATAANTKYQNDLTAIKEAGTWKTERVITSTQNTSVSVLGSKGPILNFCANNYLGLSSHPDVVQAAIDALKSHGAGVSSVRYTVENEVKHITLGLDSFVEHKIFTKNSRIRFQSSMEGKIQFYTHLVLMQMQDYLSKYADQRMQYCQMS